MRSKMLRFKPLHLSEEETRKEKLFGYWPSLIFFLIFFPYVSPFHTPFDTQPWALIGASLLIGSLLLKRRITIPRPFLWLFLISFYALLVFAVYWSAGEADALTGLRSASGYFSIPIIASTAYCTYRHINTRLFLWVVFVWLAVGLIQYTYDVGFAQQLIPRPIPLSILLGYRGVRALAPEPSYYARVIAGVLITNEFFFHEQRYGVAIYLFVLIAAVIQLIISYSGTGMVILFLFIISKIIVSILGGNSLLSKLKLLLISVLSLFALHMLLTTILHQTRAGYLFAMLVTDPITLLRSDTSSTLRLFNPLLSLYGGVIYTHGFGFGPGRLALGVIPDWLASLLGVERSFGGRVMGGLLGAVYELGVAGLSYVGIVLWTLMAGLRNRQMRQAILTSLIIIIPLMIISGSLAFPLLGYLVGVHAAYAYDVVGHEMKYPQSTHIKVRSDPPVHAIFEQK